MLRDVILTLALCAGLSASAAAQTVSTTPPSPPLPKEVIYVDDATWGHGGVRRTVTDIARVLCNGKVTCSFMSNKDYFGPVPRAAEPYDLWMRVRCGTRQKEIREGYNTPVTITCM